MENAKEMRDEAVSEYEYDSSPELWDYYVRLYKYEFDDKSKKISNSGEVKRMTKEVKIDGREKMKMGGDCFFNFNEKKIKMFKKIDGVEGSHLADELDELKDKRHYSKENCILLPVTGGLNIVKGKAYIRKGKILISGSGRLPSNAYDRPDTFLCLVDDFYKKKDSIHDLREAGEFFAQSIFKHSLGSENFADLYGFMVSFKDVYDFAGHFLGIGDEVEDMVDGMIESGRKDIKTAGDVEKYIELARNFWGVRKAYEKTRGIRRIDAC